MEKTTSLDAARKRKKISESKEKMKGLVESGHEVLDSLLDMANEETDKCIEKIEKEGNLPPKKD